MSRKRTCAISSSISFLTSAAIWIHMEMPDATILSKWAAESRAQSHAAEKINQTGESIGHGAVNQRNFSASRLSICRPIQLTAEQSQAVALKTYFRILPVAVFGSSLTKVTRC